MNKLSVSIGIILLLSLNSCEETGAGEIQPDFGEVNVEVMASGFQIPWSIEVIGENEFLFTERLGKLYQYKEGTTSLINLLPISATVRFDGLTYGGFMDVSLHPRYADNGWVYLAYVNTDYRLSVVRFQVEEGSAKVKEFIFESNAFSIGSRIVWQDERHFFLTQGLGGNPLPEPGPQDLTNDGGKIHRLLEDGQIPPDNPIFPNASAPTTVWSYGHRDPQGLFYDENAEILYSHEHGPLGGDELNIITKGDNFGWPLFSYGLNYDETPVSNLSEQDAASSTILPIKYWGTDFRLAPSGLLKLDNSNFTDWNGSFLIGSLGLQGLFSYNVLRDESRMLLEGIGRVRDVVQLPSGNLLISIDAASPRAADEGRILKLSPK
ncbi:MAG: PQQ-dependent sugar dehydrogenase [Bacteroidia bacterium]|nr:PQQ-dependent sugar dehydrogenase [Bacteroidia bacterium]